MHLTIEQEKQAIALALEGKSIKKIVQEMGFSVKCFWEYRKEVPIFGETFARALEEGIHHNVDRLMDITDEFPDVQKARLVSENIRWIAARKVPQIYGDRLDVSVTHIVDISGALAEAKNRAAAAGKQVFDSVGQNAKLPTGLEPVDAISQPKNSEFDAPLECPRIRPESPASALSQANAALPLQSDAQRVVGALAPKISAFVPASEKADDAWDEIFA